MPHGNPESSNSESSTPENRLRELNPVNRFLPITFLQKGGDFMPAGNFFMWNLKWNLKPARKFWIIALAGCLGLLCCWLGQGRTSQTGNVWADPPAKLSLITPAKKLEPVDQQAFMQAKLTLSQELLKGLVLADYRLINQSADQLRSLSQHAYWTAASQDPVYNHFTIEFQRITQQIGENARAENLDGAAYASQLLTAVCIACHQHVRDVKAMKMPKP